MYRPGADRPQVAHICKNVYGGSDTLATTIDIVAQSAGVEAYVLADHTDTVQALACWQKRGEAVYVWGVRTSETHRGLGLAKRLVLHAEKRAREFGAGAMLSTTIESNLGMLSIFKQQHYQLQATVTCFKPDVWEGLANKTFFLEAPGSSIHGMKQTSVEEIIEPGHVWIQCTSVTQLQRSLASLRSRRQHQAAGLPGGILHSAFCWLPEFYIAHPWDGACASKLIELGSVWVLVASEGEAVIKENFKENDGAEINKVISVLAIFPEELGSGPEGTTVSVVTDTAYGLHAAGAHILSLPDTACSRIYVDGCEGFDQQSLLEEYAINEFLVLHKAL